MIQIKLDMIDSESSFYYLYGFFKSADDHQDIIAREDVMDMYDIINKAYHKILNYYVEISEFHFERHIDQIRKDYNDCVDFMCNCVKRGIKLNV